MSFQLNKEQQMDIYDSLFLLTEREIKHLKGSWAEIFSKKIFPFIDEDRFRVLYSDNPASRLNNPANVYFGLLILKEIFNQQFNKKILCKFGLSRYASLDIDSFGIVLIEAMACRCPVICSDLPGPSSIVNKNCGIIVSKGNVEILRQAIIYMLKNSKNMREKARKYIENNYS